MSSDSSIPLQNMKELQQIIHGLINENITLSVQQTMNLFDSIHPYSFNLVLIHLIYYIFCSQKNVNGSTYLKYLQIVQSQEEEINANNPKVFDIFCKYLLNFINKQSFASQEAQYFIENLLEQKLIDANILDHLESIYFVHRINNEVEHNTNAIDEDEDDMGFKDFLYVTMKYFHKNYEELSKNDWELHKKLIKEGHNPNEITKIIRNDEIEKLQEISSQSDFDFNQEIELSLYEICSFINQENVTLIDYAAFFGSIKCFKYLLMNGSDVENTGKYAIAGGNEEIIHLCEQNHSTFEGAYETAIKFHKNKIFHYIYENKIEKINAPEKLGINLMQFCIEYGNYEIFSFLEDEKIKIDDSVIIASAKVGNLYLLKYFLKEIQIPYDTLIFSAQSGNPEIVKYILEQEGIDFNAKDNNGYTALTLASSNGCTEIVKLLLEQEGIDTNAKDKFGWTALMIASLNDQTETVKLLLEQEGIDINAKDDGRNTALMLATSWKRIDIVKLLLEQEGIDINAKDNWGNTALIKACENGHIETVKLLLEQEGIDINAKNKLGDTALMVASEYGHTEIVKLLLEQEGIDINDKYVIYKSLPK